MRSTSRATCINNVKKLYVFYFRKVLKIPAKTHTHQRQCIHHIQVGKKSAIYGEGAQYECGTFAWQVDHLVYKPVGNG